MKKTNEKKNFFKDQRGDVEGGFILGCIVIGIIVVVGIIWGAITLFAAPKYETITKITYSTDGGYNYREGIQEINVNQEYYMCIEMQILASKDNTAKTIKTTIVVEYTSVVSCYLDDHPGQPITGQQDNINNTITYQFDVPASTAPAKFRVIFRCIPAAVGTFQTVVMYDDNIDPAWDKTENIRYV